MTIALDIAAGDTTHVRVNVARHVAAYLDIAIARFDTLGIASDLDRGAVVHLQAFNVALDGDVNYLVVCVDGIEFVDRFAVNESLAASDRYSTSFNDGTSVVILDDNCHDVNRIMMVLFVVVDNRRRA